MSAPLRVLIVEDSEDDMILMVRELRRHDYDLTYTRVQTPEAMSAALDSQDWDVILSDFSMPEFSALAALKVAQGKGGDIPFIIVSGTAGEEAAVTAMKAGAQDFFPKNKLTRLVPAIEREIREAADRRRRRWAEEQLRQSEERFVKAFQAGPMGISITTAEGVFVDVNESFLQLTGYDRNEVIGHTIVELDLWVDSAARDHILQAIAGGQTIRNQELRVRIKSGELRVGLCSFAAIDLPGEVCALTMFQDITERKRMERDLLEAERQRVEFEKERELIELKERFISVVSHDLRTPLAVIVSSTDILQRYQDRLSPERQQEHFRKIQKQATGMTEMMQEILLLSKAHAGKLSFDPAPTDVERFCLELFDQVRLTSKTDHDFVFNLRAPIGEAMLDEKLLQHILLNLLTNAVKYSPDGGEVRFELWEQGESLYFQISDQGIGVPPEAQARLFEPFHRAKNVGDIIGTGLGMAIVKENVDRHGGTIVCESRVGEGSTFTVTLPITPA